MHCSQYWRYAVYCASHIVAGGSFLFALAVQIASRETERRAALTGLPLALGLVTSLLIVAYVPHRTMYRVGGFAGWRVVTRQWIQEGHVRPLKKPKSSSSRSGRRSGRRR